MEPTISRLRIAPHRRTRKMTRSWCGSVQEEFAAPTCTITMKAGFWISKSANPLVLGHEVAGEVVEIGRGVTELSLGQRVAVNPLRTCHRCVFCLSGRANLCLNRRFFGSAARFPHIQGMFAELFIASEEQCVAIPESTPLRVAACAEPSGVTLHAVARAGAMLGRKLLVTGSGPIGVLVAASARLAGAAEIVVTDLFDEALAIASRMGATEVVNVRTNEARLAAFMQGGGYFALLSRLLVTCGRWKTVLGLPGPGVESCRSASCKLGSRHCP